MMAVPIPVQGLQCWYAAADRLLGVGGLTTSSTLGGSTRNSCDICGSTQNTPVPRGRAYSG
jgi:hypothetical protein